MSFLNFMEKKKKKFEYFVTFSANMAQWMNAEAILAEIFMIAKA